MKTKYFLIPAVLLCCSFSVFVNAQCSAPPPPAVSGSTVAGCVSSASFTLTATPSGTNLLGWYANSFGGNALSTNSVFTTPSLTTGTTYYVGQSTAQSAVDTLAMPTYSINVPAMETRGYYFTAPVDFVITGMRVPVVIGGTLSSIAVLKLPQAPPLYANVTNSFSTLYLNQAITGTNIVNVHIPVYAGDIIGVLGERGGYSAYGPNQGTGVFSSTLGTAIGSPTVNLYRMGMLYNLATQTPTNLWTETVNTIGIVEMYVKQSCNSTLTPVTVSVVPAPVVTVAQPPVICANSSYTLSAAGANTFTWTGGPQTSTYAINPSTTTTYSVQGSILSTCTSSITTVTVSVDPGLPILNVSSSSNTVCSGNTVALSGTGAQSYTWSGGTGSVTNNVPFVPAATQQYTLQGSNSCGVSSAMITVTVNPTPVLVTSSTPTAICEGQTATLSVSGASTYSWDVASSTGATVAVTPSASMMYLVTGTSSAGCPASGAYGLIVNPNPTVTAGAVSNKTLVCPGGSATLTAAGANSYSWSSGPATSTNLVNPQTTETFTVTGTYTQTGCFATDTIVVNVFSPALSVTSNTAACKGAIITLTADAGPNSTYLWSDGSPFSITNVTVNAPSSYTVTANTGTINGLKCQSSATVAVSVHPLPTVQIASAGTVICKNEKIILTASGGTAYTWANLPFKTASIQVTPFAASSNSTVTYSVTGTDANGCKGTGTLSIKINACIGIDEWAGASGWMEVYPNPSDGNFVIRVSEPTEALLVSELGQVISELRFTQGNDLKQTVDGLGSGVYFITGSHNGASFQKKLVVTR